MTSKGVAELRTDLGVARTHSRPHVSHDPVSEAVEQDVGVLPGVSPRFGSIGHARMLCETFYDAYNHRHSVH